MIKRYPLIKLDDVALKGRAKLRVHLLCETCLLLDVFKMEEELAEDVANKIREACTPM